MYDFFLLTHTTLVKIGTSETIGEIAFLNKPGQFF